jgi:hypothetical protein
MDAVLLAMLILFVMSGNDYPEFARVVVGPLLTILAGAAGFYFARRGD